MQKRSIIAALSAVLIAGSAQAQSAPLAFAPNQLDISDAGFKGVGGFFVPAVNLNITHHGKMFIGGKASAKAKYVVAGLEHELVQGLSRKIQEDLVTKLRGAGHTVMTYDDLKADPEVAGRERLKADKDLGIPTQDAPSGTATYIIATGSPEQAFKPKMYSPAAALSGVVKSKNLGVIVPEMWIETPQMTGEKSRGYKNSRASIEVDPGMNLVSFFVWTMGPKAGGWVKLKNPTGIADEVGVAVKESEDRTDLGLGMKRSKGDYTMTISPEPFSAAILRAGFAMNDAIVAAVNKAKK